MPEHTYTPTQYALVVIVIIITLIVWIVVIFILIPRYEKRVERLRQFKKIRRIPGPAERLSIKDIEYIIGPIEPPPDDPPKNSDPC